MRLLRQGFHLPYGDREHGQVDGLVALDLIQQGTAVTDPSLRFFYRWSG